VFTDSVGGEEERNAVKPEQRAKVKVYRKWPMMVKRKRSFYKAARIGGRLPKLIS